MDRRCDATVIGQPNVQRREEGFLEARFKTSLLREPVGFPEGSDGKEFCSEGGPGSIPGSGRSPGGVHGNPLQYSYLGNLMDRGDTGGL